MRVRKPNGWYCDYDEVTEVGKTSITLKSGGRWPLALVSSKASRSIGDRRTTECQFEEGGEDEVTNLKTSKSDVSRQEVDDIQPPKKLVNSS